MYLDKSDKIRKTLAGKKIPNLDLFEKLRIWEPRAKKPDQHLFFLQPLEYDLSPLFLVFTFAHKRHRRICLGVLLRCDTVNSIDLQKVYAKMCFIMKNMF